MAWMTGLERPVVGVAIGAIATVVIQSSSAMLGIVITLAQQDLLTLPAALVVMLGAEIGTCADTLIASIGRSRPALRAGAFHLAFNVTSAVVGVVFIDQLASVAMALPGGDSLPRQIANAHVTFNVLGVAVFIGATSHLVSLLRVEVRHRVLWWLSAMWSGAFGVRQRAPSSGRPSSISLALHWHAPQCADD